MAFKIVCYLSEKEMLCLAWNFFLNNQQSKNPLEDLEEFFKQRVAGLLPSDHLLKTMKIALSGDVTFEIQPDHFRTFMFDVADVLQHAEIPHLLAYLRGRIKHDHPAYYEQIKHIVI